MTVDGLRSAPCRGDIAIEVAKSVRPLGVEIVRIEASVGRFRVSASSTGLGRRWQLRIELRSTESWVRARGVGIG